MLAQESLRSHSGMGSSANSPTLTPPNTSPSRTIRRGRYTHPHTKDTHTHTHTHTRVCGRHTLVPYLLGGRHQKRTKLRACGPQGKTHQSTHQQQQPHHACLRVSGCTRESAQQGGSARGSEHFHTEQAIQSAHTPGYQASRIADVPEMNSSSRQKVPPWTNTTEAFQHTSDCRVSVGDYYK